MYSYWSVLLCCLFDISLLTSQNQIVSFSNTLSSFTIGLSEEARSDFKVMKDVAIYTRQGPAQRVDTLSKFVTQLNT